MELDFSNSVIEKILYKKALSDKRWLNIMSGVYNPDWFRVKYLDVLFDLTIRFYRKHDKSPPLKTLGYIIEQYVEKYPNLNINLSEINELVTEVQNLDTGVDDEIIDQNIKEFIRRKAFASSLSESMDELDGHNSEGYENAVNKCLENFDKVMKITFNDTDLGLNYFDEQQMQNHWDYIRNPEAKISTGWKSLDNFTNGGFIKDGRSLYLIMAQAGLGKSVFLSNLAVNFMKQNLKVVVISLEMSEDVYAVRFDAHISNNNINRLKETELDSIEKIKAFYKKYPDSNLIIKEYPPKSVSCADIQIYLENLRNAGHKFDVVIVDYLNLVKSQHPSDNMFKDGLDVSEKLRAISYQFKCPVISACQVNSEGMNNENVGMENLSQSRGVAFTTDFLMALFQTVDDREKGVVSARLVKNRLGGQIGKVMKFTMDPITLNLTDHTDSNDLNNDINSECGIDFMNLPDVKDFQTGLSSDISEI